ncbi:LPXTG cell wall anchor domain-containing protein, partial [Lactobacillus intestinalis]
AYDLDSLKKGEIVGEGTKLDLPTYDLDSLKKGEGTELDLPVYDLNLLKKGELVSDSTQFDLPVYDVASLKKNEIVSEDASSNLPSLHINDSKNTQESTAEKLSAQDDDSATKLDVTENKQNNQLKDNVPSSTLSSLNVKISEKKIKISSNNRSTEINNYKNIISRIKDHKLTKSVKLNAKINNHHVFSNFKNNVSLPQTGSENDNIFLLLAGIISLFTALGLSIFKKKK